MLFHGAHSIYDTASAPVTPLRNFALRRAAIYLRRQRRLFYTRPTLPRAVHAARE